MCWAYGDFVALSDDAQGRTMFERLFIEHTRDHVPVPTTSQRLIGHGEQGGGGLCGMDAPSS